jgi:predicted DNA binding CopG/RHH family protein
MPGKSTKVPKFKSEAEEAEWYATPEGRRQTQREFARALRTGTLSRSPRLKAARTDPRILEQLMEQAKESATRAISLRVPIADLERAKQIAEKTGVGYQTVLKQAIHEGLRKQDEGYE